MGFRQRSVENVDMKLFKNIYNGRRILVTGHTGFKGSWLALWLQKLGANVAGISLDPETTPNHWDVLSMDLPDHRVDIRDSESTTKIISEAAPEIVFHLAAQPLVRRSYLDPLETWSTNVVGTATVLNACRKADSLRAIVVVTTDKVYANKNWHWGYRETDPLGGHDPYSASKACSEIVAASFRSAFFYEENSPLLATVRAGNVIGGGDWSEDRLIPDLVRAATSKQTLEIRSPNATRPWQHVLECLSGYLMIGQKLLEGHREFASEWNFGPERSDNRRVIEILDILKSCWTDIRWNTATQPQPHEAALLHLDNSKAKSLLGWNPVWTLETTLQATAEWYRSYHDDEKVLTENQLDLFQTDARKKNCVWS